MHKPLILVLFALAFSSLASTAHAQRPGYECAVWVPAEPVVRTPRDVEMYAQLGAGALFREREGQLEPTFSQRVTFGLSLFRAVRVGAVFMMPMFVETYTYPGIPGATPSNHSNSASYFGGVEVAYRGQVDLLALHVGAYGTAGTGLLYVAAPEGSAQIWPVAFFGGVFGALGIAATSNTDFLLRVDVGGRVREVGPSDFLTQVSLAIDWH